MVQPRQDDARVSVVIITYNGLVHLPRLRDSLAPQLGPYDEVIILDNASADGTPDWVEQNWPTAIQVRSSANLLYTAGANAATEFAAGEVLLFLNQDVDPDVGLVDRAAAATTPTRAVSYAQQFPWSRTPVIPYMDWSGVLLWRQPIAAEESTNMLTGAALSLHRNCIALLGGTPFDSRIPHSGVDVNLSLRLARLGVDLVAVSDVGVFHDSRPSKGSILQDFRMAIRFQRSLLLAFGYACGWRHTLLMLPQLLAAGWRKADVDGMGTFPRRVGLTLATWIGYLTAVHPPKPRVFDQMDR